MSATSVSITGAVDRAVFVDLEDTLIADLRGSADPAAIDFRPHALAALRWLDAAGYALYVTTSQPGLAQGRFTRAEFAALQHALQRRLREEAGVLLAGFYTCPHAPDAAGAPRCLCRRPAPGLLRQAARAARLDLAASWVVGDTLDDIEAGARAGCRSVLVDAGTETRWRLSPLRTPTARAADLSAAARAIVDAGTAAAVPQLSSLPDPVGAALHGTAD